MQRPSITTFQISEPSDEKKGKKRQRRESTVNRSMLRLRYNRSRMFAYVGTITLAFFFDHTNNPALTLKITRIYRSTHISYVVLHDVVSLSRPPQASNIFSLSERFFLMMCNRKRERESCVIFRTLRNRT